MHMNFKYLFRILVCLVLFQSSAAMSFGNPPKSNKGKLASHKPNEMKDVGIIEHIGEVIDKNIPLIDEMGNKIAFGDMFIQGRPVLLSFIYYNCSTLCSIYLNSLMSNLKKMKINIGEDYEMVVISIDPLDSPKLAFDKRLSYVKDYGRSQDNDTKGWHFLTGTKENIKKITDQVGFKFKWDDDSEQYVHSAAAFILTPEAKMSFYHYGIGFSPKTIRLSLVEASENKIGNVVDRLVLFCLQYNPDKKTYAFYAYNLVRLLAGLTAIALFLFIGMYWYKQKKK